MMGCGSLESGEDLKFSKRIYGKCPVEIVGKHNRNKWCRRYVQKRILFPDVERWEVLDTDEDGIRDLLDSAGFVLMVLE